MHFFSLVLLGLGHFLCLRHAFKRDYQPYYILSVVMIPLAGPILYLYFETRMFIEKRFYLFSLRKLMRLDKYIKLKK